MAHRGKKQPEVTITRLTENEIDFTLEHVDVSVANALRRALIADNTSALHEEFIAHRLGMIPLRFSDGSRPEEAFKTREESDCDGYSDACNVTLLLNVVNDTPHTLEVTSRDLTTQRRDVEVVHFASEAERRACDPSPGVVIVKLGEGQELKLRAFASINTGKVHARHTPVCVATFKSEYNIRLNPEVLEKLTTTQKENFVARCQPGVFVFEDDMVKVANRSIINNIDEIRKVSMSMTEGNDQLLSISVVPNRFHFEVETNGSLRPDVVVQSALTSLRRKFEQVGEECTRLDGGGDVDMGGIAAAPHAGGMDDAWHGAGDFGASQF